MLTNSEKEAICRRAKRELLDIMSSDKDLTSNGVENASKLLDMIKDVENMEYWSTKCDYYTAVLDEMQSGGEDYSERGYSGRRHRDSRGRYSRNDGRGDGRRYNDDGSSYADGNSMRGRRGYSRNDGYDRYMDAKQSYRSNKSADCKAEVLDALEEHMDGFISQMEEMLRDSDCAEERTTIKRYLDKIKNIG